MIKNFFQNQSLKLYLDRMLINFKTETITISKTLLRTQEHPNGNSIRTKVVIQPPKTRSSCRTVPIPDFLIPIIYKYKDRDDIYVITGTDHPLEPRACLRKYKKIIHSLDVSDYSDKDTFPFHAVYEEKLSLSKETAIINTHCLAAENIQIFNKKKRRKSFRGVKDR